MPQTVGISALSVAANATSAEQLNNTLLNRAPGNGVITIAARASVTGLNIQFAVGETIVANDTVIPFTGTAGGLSLLDHVVLQTGARAFSQLSLRFRNTTGGAITVDSLIKFNEV